MSGSATPLIAAGASDEIVAWREGHAVTAARFLAEAARVADDLPAGRHVLNLCADRYRFAVAFCAAVLAGKTSLLPPNHSPELIDRLRELYDDVYVISDNEQVQTGLRVSPYPQHSLVQGSAGGIAEVPLIDDQQVVAHVFTSGSTGRPTAHCKRWARLVYNVQSEALRLGIVPGSASTLVGTVPAQHMYGFESSVLIALLGGAAFDTERPFYPADIAAALARLPRPRLLVTTPFHLKTLLDSKVALPPIDLTLCATAPLQPQLAARAEAALAAPLVEIYGCTEAGQVATRRSVAGPEWRVYDGLRLAGDGASTTIAGGHVPQPTPLADVLEVIDAEHFRLLGRSNDLVNIAGKRSSIGHLNHHLQAIDGVVDGAFWMPPEHAADAAIVRLVAFVVAPGLSDAAILAALRERIDPSFLPRPIVRLDALPRDPSGKLPAARLAALAEQTIRPARAAGAAIDDRPAAS